MLPLSAGFSRCAFQHLPFSDADDWLFTCHLAVFVIVIKSGVALQLAAPSQ
jgi:hypothetical protein